MHISPLVLRRRRARTSGPSWPRTLAVGLLGALGIVLGLVSVAGAFLFAEVTDGLPTVEGYPAQFGSSAAPQFRASRVYDRSGQVLLYEALNPAAANRRWLDIDAESTDRLPLFAQATLAFQAPTYWTHPRYDWRGAIGVILGRPSAPTLAEQLVEHTLLPLDDAGKPEAVRRLRTAILAGDLTRRFAKDQILEWYLNTADYGNLAFGIDAAALTYYGKRAGDLSLAEAAMLAGLALRPTTNPLEALTQATALRDEVLGAMLRAGFITPEQQTQARREPVALRPPSDQPSSAGSDYGRYAWDRLRESWGGSFSRWGGLMIITAEDHDLQLQTECVAATHLQRLQGGDPNLVVKAADGSPCLAAGLLPALRPSDAGTDHNLDGVAAMVVDPGTGEVLSVVGRVEDAHPAGSILYPVTYLAAFSRGYGPGTMVLDLPTGETGDPIGLFRGPVRMRMALAAGLVAATEQTFALTGSENVLRIAREMGFDLPEEPSSDTGTSGSAATATVSLEAGTNAYAILAHEGRWVGETQDPVQPDGSGGLVPITILRVEGVGGEILHAASPHTRALVSVSLAYLLNDVLSDETERRAEYGATDVLELGRPAGVVVDARPDGRATWAIGYTPERAVGVWLGSDGAEAPIGMNRLNGAAPVWHALLQYATRDLAPQGWTMPPGVREIQVCDPSGLLPTQYCPRVVREVFIDGTEPTSYDTLYQPLRVNRETGKLATLFTPIDQVEERVYLVPPPAAAAWAQASGIERPPSEYDTFLAGEPGSGAADITQPEMFKLVRGVVTLRGKANPKGFEYFRVQYGQGLNPTRWVQIGSDSRTPVASGTLAVWDTQGLDGLYSVQLVVVYGEGQVTTDAVQVTVDNAPPRVRLVLPQPGTPAGVAAGDLLVIEADVFDELGVSRVEFLVDGQRVGVIESAPYSVRWTAQTGDHAILVRAYDQTGNVGESELVRVVIGE